MLTSLNGEKSTLVQILAWCHQATSHYLSQSWLRSMLLLSHNECQSTPQPITLTIDNAKLCQSQLMFFFHIKRLNLNLHLTCYFFIFFCNYKFYNRYRVSSDLCNGRIVVLNRWETFNIFQIIYSRVPNNRGVRNNRIGWYISQNH